MRMRECGLAVGLLLLAKGALAADVSSPEIALARKLFADARAAEEAKDWQTALSRLREAVSIKETSGLRFHLAYCEEHLGKLVEALVDYERAEDLPAPANDELKGQVSAKREALLRRIPTVLIQVP